MSGFDEWKAKKHAVCSAYGETYFLGAERAWNEQQKKIDAVLKHIENEEWMDEYGDKHCSVQKIKELLK